MKDENKLFLSYATLDVKPNSDIGLSGFGVRQINADTLGRNECNLNIAWLKDPKDNDLILISADYLYFPDLLAELIKTYLQSEFSITDSQIIFSATHTHSGPALGFFREEKSNQEYIRQVFNKFRKAFNELSGKFEARYCKFIKLTDSHKLSMNRRRKVPFPFNFLFKQRIFNAPNPNQAIDHDIFTICFEDANGKPDLLLLSFACHPVFNTNSEYSSDFPGMICSALTEKNFCRKAVFFQGFGGDVRPAITTRTPEKSYSFLNYFKQLIKIFIFGEIWKNYDSIDLKNFTNKFINNFESEYFAALSACKYEIPSFSVLQDNFKISSLSGKTNKPVITKLISISQNVLLLSVSAEVNSQYQLTINELNKPVFPISNTDNHIGYLPFSSELSLGGYEVNKAAHNSGWDTRLSESSVNSYHNHLMNLLCKDNLKV